MLNKRFLFISFFAVLIVGYLFASVEKRTKAASWQPVAPGIEKRVLHRPGMFGSTQVVAVRVNLKQAQLRVIDARVGFGSPGATAEEICPKQGVTINASFFADHSSLAPLGLVVSDNKRIQRCSTRRNWGVFLLTRKGARILSNNDPLPRRIRQGVESKPRLVINGKIPGFVQQPGANRSAIGIDKEGRVILAATDGYLKLDEWALCMRDGLQCVNALNLDGGPSTQLSINGEKTHAVKGGWPVPVLIQAKSKEK